MKKRLVALLLGATMVASALVGCGGGDDAAATDGAATEEAADGEEAAGGKKIGITIQNYENAYWAGVMSKLDQILKDNGYEATIVGCEENSGKQIEQIENFITAGCDLIMVHPNDADAVEEVCGRAMKEGIKVMCWDNPMENTTANWVLDNTELGKEIGKTAAAFINEHYTADIY